MHIIAYANNQGQENISVVTSSFNKNTPLKVQNKNTLVPKTTKLMNFTNSQVINHMIFLFFNTRDGEANAAHGIALQIVKDFF